MADVTVLEKDDLAGVGEEGGRIGGEEALTVAEADEEGRTLTGDHDLLLGGFGAHVDVP